MPLPKLTNNDTSDRPVPVKQSVEIQPPIYRGVTVDTRYTGFDILTTYISGQAWNVDYYSQLVGSGDAVANFQADLPAAFQQYKLIRGFELKVDDPLSEGEDGTTKDRILTGSAKVYGVFVPKEGDVFIADIGDGREALISVNRTTRLSHYEDSPYQIEYSVTALMSEETRQQLDQKVQETVFFKKDFMQQGFEPLLHGDSVDIINKLNAHYSRLISLYFNDFYSRNHKSLLVPNQPELTYDPFVVKFLKTILSTDEHPTLRHIIEFNVSEDQAMYEFTLWNCIASMDYSMLPMCVHEAGIIPVDNFYSRPLYNSIYYSGVKQVVYPDMSQTNVDAGYCHQHDDPVLSRLQVGRARFEELNRLMKQSLEMDPTLEIYEAQALKGVSDIRRVTYDNYYVLSKDFYNHHTGVTLSRLEGLLLNALKGDAIDIRVLEKLCDGAKYWDNVERFYYIPILFALLRVYPRRIK